MFILEAIYKIFTYIVYVITIYYIALSFFGLYMKRDKKEYHPINKFALIVAAHNEEVVISDMVKSLKEIDYPEELYDIYVVADNCTDKTAEKAKKSGALVCERFDKKNQGKGFAMEWMFRKLSTFKKKYDAVAIFDADNLVSHNFLTEMNKKLCEGYSVVQGYLDSKNPEDTWITGAYSISFWTTNRMFQVARNNLNLSAQLGGTGCCIKTDVLRKLGWGATCLTEDLEFSCKLVLNGSKVGFAHEAVVYDEKPLKLMQSWHQRKRWMQGFADVSERYFFKLMKNAILKHDFKSFDCALYSIQPIQMILTTLVMIIGFIKNIVGFVNNILVFNMSTFLDKMNVNRVTILTVLLVLIAIFQFVYTPLILILEKKFNLKIFWYYIVYPLYAITWLPIAVQGIIHKNDKDWNHTKHTRNISIDDLEKAN